MKLFHSLAGYLRFIAFRWCRAFVFVVMVAVADAHAADISLEVDNLKPMLGDVVNVTIRLTSAGAFSTWGCELDLPAGVSYVSSSTGTFNTFVSDARTVAQINTSQQVHLGGYVAGQGQPNSGSGTLAVVRVVVTSATALTFKTVIKDATHPFGNVFIDAAGIEIVPTVSSITLVARGPDNVWLDASGVQNAVEGGAAGCFTLRRQASVGNLTVNLEIGGSAIPGIDFVPIPTTATIVDGTNSIIIPLTSIQTAQVKGSQTVVINLLRGDGYAVTSPTTATALIISSTGPGSQISFDKTQVVVGDTVTVSVNITGAPAFRTWGGNLRFPKNSVQLISQTVGDFADFVPDAHDVAVINAVGEVHFGGGKNMNSGGTGALGKFTFRVTTAGTLTFKAPAQTAGEPFGLAIIDANNQTIIPISAADGVANAINPPQVRITSNGTQASEAGPTGVTMTLTRTTSVGPLTVALAYSGTSQDSEWQGGLPNSASFIDGVTTTTFTLIPIDDTIVQGLHSLTVSVVDGATYDLGSPSSQTISRIDNDGALITLSTPQAQVQVGGTVTVNADLSGAGSYRDWALVVSFPNTSLALAALPTTPANCPGTFVSDARPLQIINASGEIRLGGYGHTGTAPNGRFAQLTFTVLSTGTITISTRVKGPGVPFGDVLMDASGAEQIPNLAGNLLINPASNHAPTDITLSPVAVDENRAPGWVVGTLTDVDIDVPDTATYSLVTGTGSDDNALFVVTGNVLNTATALDYEVKATRSVRLRVTDGTGATFEKVLIIAINNRSDRLYVNPAATGSGDGSSWLNACPDLATALAQAYPGMEIWVVGGSYHPTITTDRTASLVIGDQVTVLGGFNGTETSANQRNWATNRVILSGDIGVVGDPSDNSIHVVSVGAGSVLDGVIITAGNANTGDGAGILVTSPAGSAVTLIANTVVYGNQAGRGGGIASATGPITLDQVVVTTNTATNGGGGIWLGGSGHQLESCTIVGNTGGGVVAANATSNSVLISNSVFTLNGSLSLSGIGITADHCVVRAAERAIGSVGVGMVDADPQLINPALPAGADGIFMTADDGLFPNTGSPCRDISARGSPPIFDMTHAVRVVGSAADVGAYEGVVALATPMISSITPAGCLLAGGTTVTISGVNLTGTTGITFGGVAATSVVVVNGTSVTCVTPATSLQSPGSVDVVLTTGIGTVTSTNGFYYGTAPTVAVTPNGTLTNAAPITFTLTFSTAVTGLSTSGLTVGNGSIGTINGSGTTYTVPITPTANGAVTLLVKANAATDAHTLANVASNTASVTYDTVAPTVGITPASGTVNVSPVVFTLTFSKPVTGLSANGLTVSNGNAGPITPVSSTIYTVPVTPTAQGAVTLLVKANAANDAAGNPNPASATASVVYSTTALTVNVTTTGSITNQSPITFTLTFSAPVTGLSANGLTVTNGTAGTITGQGTTYTVPVTPTANGAVTLTVNAGAAINANQQSNVASSPVSVTYDTIAPTVSIAPNSGTLTTSPITFTLTFSKTVTTPIASGLTVTGGSIGTISGSGTTYTVPVTPAAQGIVTLAVKANAVTDLAGNSNALSGTASVTYSIPVAPTVAVSAGSTLTNQSPITFTLTFSAPVTGLTTNGLTVTNGVPGTITGQSTIFTVPVTPTNDGPLTVMVKAGAANDAANQLGNLASNVFSITYDSTAPTVVITPNGTATNTTPISFTLAFSEPVAQQLIANGLTVTNGVIGQITGTIQTPIVSVTPSGQGLVTLSVKAGAVSDLAGNSIAASATAGVLYDSIAPVITVTPTGTTVTSGPLTFTITSTESVSGMTLNAVSVNNGAATNLISQNNDTVFTVDVMPTATGAVSLMMNGNVLSDVAGNHNAASNLAVVQFAPVVTFQSVPDAIAMVGQPFEALVSATSTQIGAILSTTWPTGPTLGLSLTATGNGTARLAGVIPAGTASGATSIALIASDGFVQSALSFTITVIPSQITTVTAPIIPVADATHAPQFAAIGLATDQGVAAFLAAIAGKDKTQVRAFAFDAAIQDYVELPTQPSGGLTPHHALFVVSRIALELNLDGTPTPMPTALILKPGWNFLSIPPLHDGLHVQTVHPWNHFQLQTMTGVPVTDPVSLIGTPGGNLASTQPWLWNGTGYDQVASLNTGAGYWFKNNGSVPLRLVRQATAISGTGALAGARFAAASLRSSSATDIIDRGAPPAPPTSTNAAQGSASDNAASGGGCGMGSGLSAALLMSLALLLRIRLLRPRERETNPRETVRP